MPANSAEATRDLQDRVGRFARTIFAISGLMLLATLANGLVAGPGAASMSPLSLFFHAFSVALVFGVWRLTRGRTLVVTTILALDAALTLTLCTMWALLGIGISPQEPIEFSIILATTFTLVARSVVVPSTFVRTLVISAVSVVPTILFFIKRSMSFVPHAPAAQVHTFLLYAILWCLVAAFTAALQSRLLYGLRQRIREASKLGQYTLAEKIGEGGMGVVYRANHAMLRRPAAIKLLLAERAGEMEVMRFEREVQLTSRLMHPNTVSIFDYGRAADGTFYYVMEFLDGFDLEWLIEEEGPLEPARVIYILSQTSGALVEAHSLGLIHRDIKPANIILTERSDEADIVKVVDFGLVKSINAPRTALTVTNTASIIGTPLYLAPEAIRFPETIDGRADLYALGAVGYYLLTGRHVFEANSVVEMCSKHLLEVPIAPSARLGRAVPADLEQLILTCLAKSPDDRPASAAVFKQALASCAKTTPYDPSVTGQWWQQRAPVLRSRRKSIHQGDRQMTVAIDLDDRSRLDTSGRAAA